MDRLYYLTEEQFTQISRLLPPEDSGRGRPPKIRNREALEGILHILRTGTPWRDLPPQYGAWHTIYMRWHRWVERGVWWNILMVLKRLKRIELHLVCLDSTVVRAHQHAAGAPKKGRASHRPLAWRAEYQDSCAERVGVGCDRHPHHCWPGRRCASGGGDDRRHQSMRWDCAGGDGQGLRQQRYPRQAWRPRASSW